MNRIVYWFLGIPIRWKIVAMMLAVTAISLILVSVGLLLHTRTMFEHQMKEKLTLLADVMGLNSTAALAFNDAVAATETLAALRSDPHVLAGGLYDTQGRLFARYLRADLQDSLLAVSAPAQDIWMFTGERATLVRTIIFKQRAVGKIHLVSDTTEWHSVLWGFIGITALLFVIILNIGLFVSFWMQRLVTRPITDLAEVTRRVGQERDTSLRAVKRGDDELGTLVDGFNTMLDEIAKSRAELHQLNEDLEKRVLERTAQLVAANHELETFSYSVSHDLRSPLRAIDGFSRILLDDYKTVLDDAGRGYLDRVRHAAQRMGLLIDDLLRLAHITRIEPSREIVNLSAIAQEIGKSLHDHDPQRHVRLELTPNLTTHGDPQLLRIALENLLGNAWKFTASRSESCIELGVKMADGAPTYFIRDNGAGFDMAYAGKLFSPFQRLHKAEEFAGTGIGLATVQRIIRKHGGRIWAEGTVGQGAAFYFTLAQGETNTGGYA